MNKKTVKIRVIIDAISQDISTFDNVTWGKVICVKKGAIKLIPDKDYIQHHGKINESDRITLKGKFIKKYKIKKSVFLSFIVDSDKSDVVRIAGNIPDLGGTSISFKDSYGRIIIAPLSIKGISVQKIFHNGMLLVQGSNDDYTLNNLSEGVAFFNHNNFSSSDKFSFEVRFDGQLDLREVDK